MLTVKEKGILGCILEHCSNINEAIVSINQSDFINNKIIQNSICFDLLQIGELAKKFDPNFIKEYGNSPWKDSELPPLIEVGASCAMTLTDQA